MSKNQISYKIKERNFIGSENVEKILLTLAEYTIDKTIENSYALSMASATSEEVAK